MYRVNFFVCFLLLVWFTSDIYAGDDVTPSFPLKFKSESVSFDDITEGKKQQIIFKCKNTSQHTVSIKDIKADCSCTVASNKIFEVQAGKEALVELLFNSFKKEGKQIVDVTIVYEMNGNTFRHPISFYGNVRRKGFLESTPGDFYLGNVSAHTHFAKEFVITAKNANGENIIPISLKHPKWMQAKISAAKDYKDRWILSVDGYVPDITGNINEAISILSNSPNNPETTIRILGQIKGSIDVSPKSLVKVVTAQENNPQFSLVLMEVNGDAIQYLKYDIECEIDANCNVKVIQTESKNTSQIVLNVIPSFLDENKNVIRGALVLAINKNSKEEKIRIPFLFIRSVKH